MALISIDQAQQLVLQNTARLPTETTALDDAVAGTVLSEDIVSSIDSPPFDKSMVDGYAVRSVDVLQSTSLQIVCEILAGVVSTRTLQSGEAASIMTGAALPDGADAVVMHEQTTLDESNKRVNIPGPVKTGQNIMRRAAEIKQGEVVLTHNTILRPQELGLLATLGCATFHAYRRPRVAILSTGDELVEPGEPLLPGQIRNSNASLLKALVRRAGGIPQYLGIAKDTLSSLGPLIRDGLQADVLLITGGVSAGKVDLVPEVLAEASVQAIFHKVALKPGKPLLFGVKNQTLVFGLPGNPVSGLIGFELFVRPALRKLMGHVEPFLAPLRQAKLTADYVHKSDRPTYYPVQLRYESTGWSATPITWRGSGDLRSICLSNGFAVFPAGEVRYAAGSVIDVLMPEFDPGS